MKRNFNNLNSYLNKLLGDVYAQPEDTGHSHYTEDVIKKWVANLNPCESVLDVGAGEGFAQPLFEKLGIAYQGISFGNDVTVAQQKGRNVISGDFSFLPYEEDSFDLIFSRHSAEHSAVGPLLSFMEWYRVARNWLCLVVPNLDHFTYKGQNHYYVLPKGHYKRLLERSGWNIVWQEDVKLPTERNPEEFYTFEHRFMCEKVR